MTRMVLDKDTIAKLFNLSRPLEICDESGSTLGHFLPVEDKEIYRNIQIPISEEELEKREREPGGRSLKEILHDLEKLT